MSLPLPDSIRPSAGRPTRAQAARRQEELLDHALELFLDNGFELTTLDAVAAAVGMTKRTVYARYDDKRALFKAAVQRAVDRWVVPPETLQAADTGELATTLAAIARLRIKLVMSPEGIRLNRILNAESYRFPEVFIAAIEQGTGPVIAFLAALLRRHIARGELAVADPELAATVFLSMAVGGPARAFSTGNPIDEKRLEDRVQFCVRLFLDGVRTR
jgi:AcrR family transcriptional regulator